MAETQIIHVPTLKDILNNPNMSLSERQQLYGVSGVYSNGDRHIERVIINKNEFTDYKAFSFLREKTYVKEPIRSGAGVIGNLNSYATFLTPRLKIDFSMLSIDSYRSLMTLIYGKNEFEVTCYDVVANKDVTHKMYFHPTEMPKLWTIARLLNGEESIELLGVEDFTVELVGTNADIDLVGIIYYYDDNKMRFEASGDVYVGDELVIGDGITFIDSPPAGKEFSHWQDANGTKFYNGDIIKMSAEVSLVAVWKPATSLTLSYNYGISSVYTPVDPSTGIATPMYDKRVKQGESIGTLPTIDASPVVSYGNPAQLYYPYTNGAWYRLPIKDESVRVKNNDLYWTDRNSIIYCLYDLKDFSVNYVTDNGYSIPTQYAKYGNPVYMPTIVKDGYNFGGWYEDATFTKRFSGTMPPYSITLYAKWVSK